MIAWEENVNPPPPCWWMWLSDAAVLSHSRKYGANTIAVYLILTLCHFGKAFFLLLGSQCLCVCVLAGQGRKAVCLVVGSDASGDEED